MPPIDVLVVGIGRWGERHLATLKEMQDDGEIGKLYAYDIDYTRKEVVERYGAIWSSNIRQPGIAAVVSTTSASHFEVASCLIAEGMHVLIEKPMAQNLADANALMNESLANGSDPKKVFVRVGGDSLFKISKSISLLENYLTLVNNRHHHPNQFMILFLSIECDVKKVRDSTAIDNTGFCIDVN